jgi:carboxyl-terminal processing protease
MKKFAISVIVLLFITMLFLGACDKEEEYTVTKEQYEFLQSISAEDYERLSNMDLLLEAMEYCENNYYSDIDYVDADAAAARAYVKSLDRYSYMMLASEAANQSTAGIGLQLDITDYNEYRINYVHPDTPAAAASEGGAYHMQRGDFIYAVNGKRVDGGSYSNFVRISAGGVDTELTLTIRRGMEILDENFICVKQELTLRKAYYINDIAGLPSEVGYIRYISFEAGSDADFMSCISSFIVDDNEYLILDLRGNGGGSSAVLSSVASYLVTDEGDNNEIPLIYFEPKGKESQVFSTEVNFFIDVPIIVLVDKNTASASEALISAMRYYGTGVIIGSTTYGKGTGLNSGGYIMDDNNDVYVISVVVGKYYVYTDDSELDLTDGVADGKWCIEGVGLEPDVEVTNVEFTDDLGSDADIQAAIDYWNLD